MFFKKKNDSEARLKEAEGYRQKGMDLVSLGQNDKAEKEYLKSLSILEPLLRKSDSEDVMKETALAYDLLSLLGMGKGTTNAKLKEASGWAKKAVELREKLVAKNLTTDALDKLAYSCSNLGYTAGDFVVGNRALQIWKDLQKMFPGDPIFAQRVKKQEEMLKQMASEFGL